MKREEVKKYLENLLTSNSTYIIAAAGIATGNWIYAIKEGYNESLFIDIKFEVLNQIESFINSNKDTFQQIIRESKNYVIILKKVIPDDKGLRYLLLSSTPDTTFGMLLLQMQKIQKEIVRLF